MGFDQYALPVHSLDDLKEEQERLKRASAALKATSDSLSDLAGGLQERVRDFYNELVNAKLPLSVTAAMTAYLADRTTAPGFSADAIPGTLEYPRIVAEAMREKKYDPQIVEIFFKYAEKDLAFGSMAVKEVSVKLRYFNDSLNRVGRFLTLGTRTAAEFRERAQKIVEKRVTQRNNLYNKEWDTMLVKAEELLAAKEKEVSRISDVPRVVGKSLVDNEPVESKVSLKWKESEERRLLVETKMLARFERWPKLLPQYQIRLGPLLSQEIRQDIYSWIERTYHLG